MLLRGCLGRRTGPSRSEVAGSGVLGEEDLALAVGGGRVRGTGSNCSGMWGKGWRVRWKSRRESETVGTLSYLVGTTD